MNSHTIILMLVVTATLSFATGVIVERRGAEPLESRIIRAGDARLANGDWGSIRIYTEEQTNTVGLSSALTAQLEFLPGKRLQPPHRHPEEEFQYVIEGTGTWFLNGKDIPLQPGDLMYARPGDLHGISNTGSAPLRFLVFKWRSARGQ